MTTPLLGCELGLGLSKAMVDDILIPPSRFDCSSCSTTVFDLRAFFWSSNSEVLMILVMISVGCGVGEVTVECVVGVMVGVVAVVAQVLSLFTTVLDC